MTAAVGAARARSSLVRVARVAAPPLAIWLVAGAVLAQATGRVKDWFVMTDELYYERLAISIAHSGSPLPRIHGEAVPNVSQLLPLLLSPFYRGALVPDALHAAHVFDAFVFASAAVPAFLLARRATRSGWLAAGVAVLAVAVPWAVYASVLLTEVVAYPAFLWALLAIERAVAAPRARNDLVALAGVALAVLARTQLLALALVLPLAILLVRPRQALRAHRLLAGVYGLAAVAVVALAATGNAARLLGTYRAAGEGNLVPPYFGRSLAEHVAAVALAVGVLPFLAAAGWALARVARPRERERTAFAACLVAAIVVLCVEVTSFDLRWTGLAVSDRYLFYLVPLVLAGCAAAIVDPPWPRWALAAPLAVVALGFSGLQLPGYEKLQFDRPLAVVYEQLVGFAGSAGTARWLLVAGTVAAAALLVEGTLLLPRRAVAACLAALALVALPAETGAAFTRFFSVDGTSGRPITLDQGVVFDWIDRTVGPTADVAMVGYPVVPGDYWAGTAFWWDAEFWNASVAHDVVYRERFYATPSSFPKLRLRFDPASGRANVAGSEYVAQAQTDARFRLAGKTVGGARGVDLIRAARPWRAAWTTTGLYDDGWTRPGRTATIRLYPAPGQRQPQVRYLDVRLRAPEDAPRAFTLSLPGKVVRGAATGDTSDNRVQVCVPARGSTAVRLRVPEHSRIYGDPVNSVVFGTPREAGLQVVQIGLADELGPAC